MSKVYFCPLPEDSNAPETVAAFAAALLEHLVAAENLTLSEEIPLKVHFGEKGNRTYLPQSCFLKIIEFLNRNNIRSKYMETSVLYGGERYEAAKHRKLAQAHGFDALDVVIADGEKGERSINVPVAGKHFSTVALAEELVNAKQVLVLSHFKGHMLAGFGGAIKQLSMGFASKGGKMAMHMGVKPRIRRWLCRYCGACKARCNVQAITIDKATKTARIDSQKCIGCGACFSRCPHHAISILSWAGLWNTLCGGRIFREKLVEYALGASKDKPHIYLNFMIQVTRGCDCEPHYMRPIMPDVGIFASLDPVAVDSACYQAAMAQGKKFRGGDQLAYAEKMGLGKRSFSLETVDISHS